MGIDVSNIPRKNYIRFSFRGDYIFKVGRPLNSSALLFFCLAFVFTCHSLGQLLYLSLIMFLFVVLFSLLTSIATSLPSDLQIENSCGNPFDPKCNLDACLDAVIAEDLFPDSELALQDCSAALQIANSSAAAINTVTITALPSQSTSTITQIQTIFSTTLFVSSQTGTIVSTIYSTETDDVATLTSMDVVEITSTTSLDISTTIVNTLTAVDVVSETDTTFIGYTETDHTTATETDMYEEFSFCLLVFNFKRNSRLQALLGFNIMNIFLPPRRLW